VIRVVARECQRAEFNCHRIHSCKRRLKGLLPNSNSRWCVSDPRPPSAAFPLTEAVQVMQKGPVLGKNRVKPEACRNNFETGHRNRS
jgi:hypothetical protein